MNDTSLKIKIAESGYTHKYLAAKINVSQTFFSQVVNGHRNLSLQKEEKLKQILRKSLLQNVA